MGGIPVEKLEMKAALPQSGSQAKELQSGPETFPGTPSKALSSAKGDPRASFGPPAGGLCPILGAESPQA